ncbi:unnamed protein product [Leptidea sinapis]|uniref:Uncharacterized protein n=1 Tax=Leptidea sinapis TaxID=189913 RepID=A0A5E4QKY3_9NEOP|nr:unnamed protein product [Leptidea sinapis]
MASASVGWNNGWNSGWGSPVVYSSPVYSRRIYPSYSSYSSGWPSGGWGAGSGWGSSSGWGARSGWNSGWSAKPWW